MDQRVQVQNEEDEQLSCVIFDKSNLTKLKNQIFLNALKWSSFSIYLFIYIYFFQIIYKNEIDISMDIVSVAKLAIFK